jgi:hypothetical protein
MRTWQDRYSMHQDTIRKRGESRRGCASILARVKRSKLEEKRIQNRIAVCEKREERSASSSQERLIYRAHRGIKESERSSADARRQDPSGQLFAKEGHRVSICYRRGAQRYRESSLTSWHLERRLLSPCESRWVLRVRRCSEVEKREICG